MEEQNNLEQQEIEQQEVEEPARREFVSKLVTTAGAVALAGLLSGGESEAVEVQPAAAGTWQMGKFRTVKIRNGFRMSMSGKEIGTALQQAGLLQQGVNLDNAAITIEFTV